MDKTHLSPEQICHCQLALDVIGIAAGRESERSDHRDEHRLLGASLTDECFPALADAAVLFLGYDVGSVRIFHLTEVDRVVVSVDKHIDLRPLCQRLARGGILRPLACPGMDAAHDGREAEGRLDLVDVLHAYPLEGPSRPAVMDG